MQAELQNSERFCLRCVAELEECSQSTSFAVTRISRSCENHKRVLLDRMWTAKTKHRPHVTNYTHGILPTTCMQ